MSEIDEEFLALLESRRELAVSMLRGFAAGAFERPHTPEDVALYEAELEECETQIAALQGA